MTTRNPMETQKRQNKTIRQSNLYKDWYFRVGSGHPNDYVIAISANPRATGVSGTGKTTLALRLAKTYFDVKESDFDAKKQATLDPTELAQEVYPNTEEGAAIIYDEAQGTPSSTGLNSKRTMKEESLNAINTVATRRKDRNTLIIVTQNIKSLVGDLYDFIDSWLLIQDDVNYYASHYGVHPDVFNFETRKTETPGIEDITWEPFPKSDPDYRHLDKLKDEATEQAQEDESERELPKVQQAELARALKEANDVPWSDVADLSESLTYSGDYLRRVAKDEL